MLQHAEDFRRQDRHSENRCDFLLARRLILGRLDRAAAVILARVAAVWTSLPIASTTEEFKTGNGLQFTVRGQRHPGECQQNYYHCSKCPHAQYMPQGRRMFNTIFPNDRAREFIGGLQKRSKGQ